MSDKEKTKNCPKCSEKILASAIKCKHCGADLRNWFARHKILTVILVIILIGVIGNMFGGPQYSQVQPTNSTQPTSPQKTITEKVPEEIIKISAQELYAKYEANEIAADELYKDKILEVSGIIDSIGKDIMDSMYVTLKTDNIIGSVQCMLANSEISKAVNLKKGSSILVKGKNSGLLMNVILRNCTIQ